MKNKKQKKDDYATLASNAAKALLKLTKARRELDRLIAAYNEAAAKVQNYIMNVK